MKKEDFLAALLRNEKQARIMRVFLFSPEHILALKDAAKRSGLSAAAAAREIKALEKLGIVKKGRAVSVTLKNGKSISAHAKTDVWSANQDFPQFAALARFIREISPSHHDSIAGALRRAGRVSIIVLSGHFVGDATRPIDLLIAGEGLSTPRLERAMRVLEPKVGREIRYAFFTLPELRYRLTIQDRLVRDTLDYPHLVLLDKTQVL